MTAGGARSTRYALGLGSNRCSRHGPPAATLRAAIAALDTLGVRVTDASPIIATPPLGPSRRRFANAALLVETTLAPIALLALVKTIERGFGRRRGRRWDARVLDIDLLLWSGGTVATRGLAVPHPALAERLFVLQPLDAIVPRWRVPPHGRTVNALTARHIRLTRRKPLHRDRRQSGP